MRVNTKVFVDDTIIREKIQKYDDFMKEQDNLDQEQNRTTCSSMELSFKQKDTTQS